MWALFLAPLLAVSAPPDDPRQSQAEPSQAGDQSSGLFGPCGNRQENIEKYGPENPYQQLRREDFKTIRQWGRLAMATPRPPSRRTPAAEYQRIIVRNEELARRCWLAASTVADIGILHGRGQHQLGQTELEECRGELLKMLKSRDANVRAHALKGLAAVGERFHVVEIEKLLEDEHWKVRQFATEAVAAIEEREKKGDDK